MENTLQLIDDVLKERKIRWSYADGLYTLSMGSYPAFIQVESDHDMQLFVREISDDPETELYGAIEYSDTPFSKYDVWDILNNLIYNYHDIVGNIEIIEKHFSAIATLVEEQEISYATISRLFDKYLGE